MKYKLHRKIRDFRYNHEFVFDVLKMFYIMVIISITLIIGAIPIGLCLYFGLWWILSAFIICSLILSSPFVVDVKDPLARTTPALPLVDNLYKICCSHAKLALFFGGTPYFHLGSPSKVLFHHTF